MIIYRKTKQGIWVVCGPVNEVKPGYVTVTKKNGQTEQKCVERVGKPFKTDKGEMCYGYLVQDQKRSGGGRKRRSSESNYCAECGEYIRSKNQRCWETGMTCYPEENY